MKKSAVTKALCNYITEYDVENLIGYAHYLSDSVQDSGFDVNKNNKYKLVEAIAYLRVTSKILAEKLGIAGKVGKQEDKLICEAIENIQEGFLFWSPDNRDNIMETDDMFEPGFTVDAMDDDNTDYMEWNDDIDDIDDIGDIDDIDDIDDIGDINEPRDIGGIKRADDIYEPDEDDFSFDNQGEGMFIGKIDDITGTGDTFESDEDDF